MSGAMRQMPNLYFISLIDAWNGKHPRNFTPSDAPVYEIGSAKQTVNWLLANPETAEFIRKHTPAGVKPMIASQKFDAETERMCKERDYDLIMPSRELREHLDSKITTTELGNRAGVPSAPNILTTVTDWDDLRRQAEAANLGNNLVLQQPWGDSGATTYFINSEADWDRVAKDLVNTDVKVMKYVQHLPLATEVVLLEHGCIITQTLREVTGHTELTRHKGGWVGSEFYPSLISAEVRDRIEQQVIALCDELRKTGYRGEFEVSTLYDPETQECYLGELNVRVAGSITLANLDHNEALLPIFVYHVLEFAGVELDAELIDAINEENRRAFAGQTWSVLVAQYNDRGYRILTEVPESGFYRFNEQTKTLSFVSGAFDAQTLTDEDEVYLQVGAQKGGEVEIGGFKCMAWSRRRLQEDHYALSDFALSLNEAIDKLFITRPGNRVERALNRVRRVVRRKFGQRRHTRRS